MPKFAVEPPSFAWLASRHAQQHVAPHDVVLSMSSGSPCPLAGSDAPRHGPLFTEPMIAADGGGETGGNVRNRHPPKGSGDGVQSGCQSQLSPTMQWAVCGRCRDANARSCRHAPNSYRVLLAPGAVRSRTTAESNLLERLLVPHPRDRVLRASPGTLRGPPIFLGVSRGNA